MKKLKVVLLLLPLLFSLVSCGPIIGQLSRLDDGVKGFQVISGDLALLRKGQHILVVGPFAHGPGAWDIARGDEAVFFNRDFNNNGFFNAELLMNDAQSRDGRIVAEVKGRSRAAIKADYRLEAEPDVVMFATVLGRETFVAPTRGIIMTVSYRLEFYDPATTKSTVVEVSVHEPFKDCVKTVVEELARRVLAASL